MPVCLFQSEKAMTNYKKLLKSFEEERVSASDAVVFGGVVSVLVHPLSCL